MGPSAFGTYVGERAIRPLLARIPVIPSIAGTFSALRCPFAGSFLSVANTTVLESQWRTSACPLSAALLPRLPLQGVP